MRITPPLRLLLAMMLLGFLLASQAQAAKPLRIFIRASAKTHGPGAHDYPRFLADWTTLLRERGAQAQGALRFPTRAELNETDVLVLYASDGADVAPADRNNLESYLRWGGGMVVLHDGICGSDPEWFARIAGGAKKHGVTNWQTGRVSLYVNSDHPITAGLSNFDLDDELFYHIQMAPEARVLATTFHTANEIVPQMWTYEKRRSRVFVSVQGHKYTTFSLPHYRGVLLRAIAWAGRREIDSLTRVDELAHFRYPEGGPIAPEKAASRIQISPEFTLSLVAAEPLIANPISVEWDSRGRMWVAVTPEYPFKEGKGRSRDAIVILDDTDGDLRMDRRSVFYEGLVLPTSFVHWKDGVIVAQAPEILVLRDRNGDGRAERREVLFSGFGTADTHAVINNFRWGLDGWIYGCQGDSGKDSTNIVNARGRKFGKIGNGIFRFKPDGTAIEQVSSYSGNSWGIDFSDEGELFFSKANGPHVNHVVMPQRYLSMGNIGKTASDKSIEDHQKANPIFSDPRHDYLQGSAVGAFITASGCTIYQGGIWPEKYHGSHFVCEPNAHIVHEDIINRAENPSFEATRRDTDEFIAGRDPWFRPVHTRVGPDGQMYLLDFYNQAFPPSEIRGLTNGTGKIAIRPAGRDDDHGRIYRISHKQQRRPTPFQLDPPVTAELVRALQHPNGWVRMTAQRLLTERNDPAAQPALEQVLTNRFVHARLHALWTLHQLNTLAETNLVFGLRDGHPSVVNNSLRIVSELRKAPSTSVTAAVIKEIKGTTERTRLEALFALASSPPSSDTISAVHKLYPDLKDGWSKSTVLAIARQAPTNFIRASFASDKADFFTEPVEILTTDFLEKRDAARAEWVLRHTGRQTKVSSKIKVAVLDAFNKKLADYSIPFTTNVDAAIESLLESESKTTRIATFPLAVYYEKQGSYGKELAKVRKALLADLQNEKAKDEERNALLTGLVKVTTLQKDIIAKVDEVLAKGAPEPVQKHMVDEIGDLRDPSVAGVLIRNLDKLKAEPRLIAFSHLIKRTDWTEQLLQALKTKGIKPSDIGVIGASRLRTHPDKRLARQASALLDELQGPVQRDKAPLIAKFAEALKTAYNHDNGREMFIRNCTICHKFVDKGRAVGPELTGAGLHGGPVLLTHILDPNRIVEGNFIAYNLITKKGDGYTGLVKTENKDSVTLRNLEGEVTVKRADIASFTSSGLSLMPEGFEALGEKNMRDILGYIISKTPKGFRPLDLSPAFTANSQRGLYLSQSDPPSLVFKQFGVVMVDAIPFEIANPAAISGKKNVVVLKGGEGFAKSLPQRVEFSVGSAADKLYVLGGVAGWGFPYGPPEGYDVPAAKATIVYENDETEEVTWKNGEVFADYARPYDVPGSKAVSDLTTSGQLRWFSIVPKQKKAIRKVVLESFNNHLAPTFVAVTAQKD
ncbi:MAG TPA: PVC-type heme-binding CxxCH protein [Verrucomicrobiae bacterium]|nr:PVC-type heme-binding CxxCH protein [Verrucomicrobiae bacterium]